MRFFITGETFKTVGKKMSSVYVQIEPKIEALFKRQNYGDGIIYWGHVCICCPPEVYESGFFKEIKKYTQKDKDLELRLRIDYELMLSASELETFRLICESILKGVNIAEQELKVENFDFPKFRKDLITLFKNEGWIVDE